jgi:SOS-response transcriptional repressor LexA
MGKRLKELMFRATEEAAVSIVQLAQEAGYHWTTFAKYREGTREPTAEAAAALAKVLRRRGRRLLDLADRLEKLARSERERRRR